MQMVPEKSKAPPDKKSEGIFQYNAKVGRALLEFLGMRRPAIAMDLEGKVRTEVEKVEGVLDGERPYVEQHWIAQTDPAVVAELVAFRNGLRSSRRDG